MISDEIREVENKDQAARKELESFQKKEQVARNRLESVNWKSKPQAAQIIL